MAANIFDKDTLLDLTVNIVPLIIMAFFIVLFLIYNPWRDEATLGLVLQFALIVTPFVGLAILTYASAKRIEE